MYFYPPEIRIGIQNERKQFKLYLPEILKGYSEGVGGLGPLLVLASASL
jgi:hypothetical protein